MHKPIKLFLIFLFSAYCLPLTNVDAATSICKWKDNKQCAFSMSFDDAMCTHANYVIPQLIQRGLTGTFYTPCGNLSYGYEIMTWESLVSRSGIDLENHTFYHSEPPATLDALMNQLDRCAQVLWQLRAPGSSKLMLFCLSGSWNWASPPFSQVTPGLLTAHYCVPTLNSRGPEIGESNDEGAMNGLSGAMTSLNYAIDQNGWTGYHWHGVGPQAEYLYFNRGWLANDFAAFLDTLVASSTYVWVATNMDAHKYYFERTSASNISASTPTANSIYLTLVSTADPSLYDYPLTLLTDVPAGWLYCKITQENRITVTTVTANQVMYGAIPGRGEITLVQAAGFDSSAPGAPAVVRDGTGADTDLITNLNQISANWDAATDTETGIAKYWYKVGTTSGGSEVFDWVDNGTFTYVTTGRTNLSLSRGTTYYVTVKAVNGAGLESVPVASNGQRGQTAANYIKFADDFEAGDFARWGAPSQSGNSTIQILDGAGYGGTKGLKVHTEANSATIAKANVSSMADTYIQFYIKLGDLNIPRLATMGDNGWGAKCVSILQMRGASGNFIGSVLIGKAETGINIYEEFIENTGGYQCVPTWPGQYWGYLAFSTGVWHCVDLHVKADSESNGGVEMWIDRVKVFSYLHRPMDEPVNAITLGTMSVGSSTVSTDIYFDNVKVSDSYIYMNGDSSPGMPTSPGGPTINPGANPSPTTVTAPAYPNPYKITSSNPVKFIIPGTPGGGGEVSIYTVSGRLIKKQAGTTEINWDARNEAGEKAGRGIYIYKITSNAGNSVTGKIVLTK